MSGPRVILVGPPGAGKTTVGELLAGQHGLAFRDTDRDVETATGRSIADIFIEDGEAAFRELERAAVAAAIAEHDGVLALGGGAVLAPETRELLAGRTVVFLDVELAAACERTGLNQARPLLALNPRATLKTMLDERRPVYAAVATTRIVTDQLMPADVAAEVGGLL